MGKILEYTCSQFLEDMERVTLPKPDAILAVARGGLTPAHFIAQKLGVRELFSITARSYSHRKKVGSPLFSPLPSLSHFHRLLIVDDICDTGETLSHLTKIVKENNPSLTLSTFTIFLKPTSQFRPDFYLHLTDQWVHFFWEIGE